MHSIETLTDYQRKYPKHCSFLYDWWFAFVTCRLISALHKTGVKSLFPVQVAVWKQIIGPGGGERDLCICSPTGSGKTLAYCLPVVQMLASRVVRRLRALIVLPRFLTWSIIDCVCLWSSLWSFGLYTSLWAPTYIRIVLVAPIVSTLCNGLLRIWTNQVKSTKLKSPRRGDKIG